MDFTYGIVVPHYNSLSGLSRLLRSIPVRDDIQVIVVDDNSTERFEPQKIEQEFPMHNITFSTNDSGVKGAGSSRNIGIELLNSRYTLFADADDFYCEGAFELLDSVMNNEDIVYFSPTSQCDVTGDSSDRHFLYANLVSSYLAEKNEEIKYHFAVPWSKVYATDFIQRNRLYFDQVIASNDVMFSLVSGRKACHIAAYTTPIYCVTRGQGTLTVNFKPEVMKSRYLVEMNRINYINKHQINTEVMSLYKIIKNFRHVMTAAEHLHAAKLLFAGEITLLPARTYYYLKNPRALIARISKKRDSISSQRYQA
ncbi:glycosyltransferase [Vibrio sp. 404]|uniref:Glycosyltransferase n=1 Tax=Vibrio marinisediminis TaxID=2758441 RepID=A0A7W2FT44_9VIBR|nr:glycosyltransferase family 2 protein [Vibrio marinisediminis]MBA5763771.1 glycosyltransferase [Vibrio marinisediminis]